MPIPKLLISVYVCVLLYGCNTSDDPRVAFDKGDYASAVRIWTEQAHQGDANAQNYLGMLYYIGLGVERDYQKAINWYKKAAHSGHPDAQRNYGDMFHFGRGIKKDNYQAFKWYFAASQQGNKIAKRQMDIIGGLGNLSPNQQMHAKLEANEVILDKQKHFMSHDTYIVK